MKTDSFGLVFTVRLNPNNATVMIALVLELILFLMLDGSI